MSLSYLEFVKVCDNFTIAESSEPLAAFLLTKNSKTAVGLIRDSVAQALLEDNEHNISLGKPKSWEYLPSESIPGERRGSNPAAFTFADHISSPKERSRVLKDLCEGWRDSGRFPELIAVWRNELYPVYIDPFGPHTPDNYAFSVERAAAVLFGVVTYGVHMTIYEGAPTDSDTGSKAFDQIKIWTPKRASTKQTSVIFINFFQHIV